MKKEGKIQREYNQVVNYIYVDYPTNIYIGDKHPKDYWFDVLDTRQNLEEKEYIEENYTEIYDLPPKFWEMEYFEFLDE